MKKAERITIPLYIIILLLAARSLPVDATAVSNELSPDLTQLAQEPSPSEKILFLRDGDVFLYDHLSSRETRITQDKAYRFLLAFPDGTRLLTGASTETTLDYSIIELATGREVFLGSSNLIGTCGEYLETCELVSPDSQMVIISQGHGKTSLIFDLEGNVLFEIDRPIFSPHWSPDSREVVFFSSWVEFSERGFFRFSLDTGEYVPIVQTQLPDLIVSSTATYYHPTSPYFAYWDYQSEGYGNLHIVSPSGSISQVTFENLIGDPDLDPLTAGYNAIGEPTGEWSPSGRYFVFSAKPIHEGKDGTLVIYDVLLETTEVLVSPGGINPTWSPNEQEIAFTTPKGGLAIISFPERQVRRLVNDAPTELLVEYGRFVGTFGFFASMDSASSWSATGDWLVFNDPGGIRVVSRDGTVNNRIDDASFPAWIQLPQAPLPTAGKPVLVLVHGFQSQETDMLCDPDKGAEQIRDFFPNEPTTPVTANLSEDALFYWAAMPAWLEADYDVWIAQLQTGKIQGTLKLDANGECLQSQIRHVASQTGSRDITIVAHSMGGLVSRACLAYADCRGVVDRLVTLGSPHAGLSVAGMAQSISLNCTLTNRDGVCDMSQAKMQAWNPIHPNHPGIEYVFLGGDGTSGLPHWLRTLLQLTDGQNDGLVGNFSAVGWIHNCLMNIITAPNCGLVLEDHGTLGPIDWTNQSPPLQVWTDEYHSSAYSAPQGFQIRDDYYHARLWTINNPSYSYNCVMELMAGTPPDSIPTCRAADPTEYNPASPAGNQGFFQATMTTEDVLSPGQVETVSVGIAPGGPVRFFVLQEDGPSVVQVQSPSGIDYALESFPDENGGGSFSQAPLYEGGPVLSAIEIPNAEAGAWTISLDASQLTTGEIGYKVWAHVPSAFQLNAGVTEAAVYPGDLITIEAELIGFDFAAQPLVTALVAADTGASKEITLTSEGEHSYASEFTVPQNAGYLQVHVIARGTEDGVAWSREVILEKVISPPGYAFAGEYQAEVLNEDGDAMPDALLFAPRIRSAVGGEHLISALLYDQDGVLVSQETRRVELIAGDQSIEMRFPGNEIWPQFEGGQISISAMYLIRFEDGASLQLLASPLPAPKPADQVELTTLEPQSEATDAVVPPESGAGNRFGVILVCIGVLLVVAGGVGTLVYLRRSR